MARFGRSFPMPIKLRRNFYFPHNYTTALSDVITITDDQNSLQVKPVAYDDTFTVTDSMVKGISRALAETLTITDSMVKGVAKIFSENMTISDV